MGAVVANGMSESQGLFKILVLLHHIGLDLDVDEVHDQYVLRIISVCFWWCLQSRTGGRFVNGFSSVLGKCL